MLVITCCNKQFSITCDEGNIGSEYIKDIVKTFGNSDATIPVPNKYYTIISNYVEFLKDNHIPITSRERLLLCFQLNTLFVDDSYFKHCVQQVLGLWSYMCIMIYNDFNNDLQWFFFVYAPYDFIPKRLLDNDTMG